MATVVSSQLQAKPLDTGADPRLDVTPDPAGPLKPGKYNFAVMVSDGDLQSVPATWVVEVRDLPVVTLTGPKIVGTNQTISLAATGQTIAGTKPDFVWSVKQVG